jgi:hypothetical protein
MTRYNAIAASQCQICYMSNGGTIGTLAVEAPYREAGGAVSNFHKRHFIQNEGIQLNEQNLCLFYRNIYCLAKVTRESYSKVWTWSILHRSAIVALTFRGRYFLFLSPVGTSSAPSPSVNYGITE